jgi:formamidopyrimidine-DNA glycosylase
MPELPDLLYIQKYLRKNVKGKSVADITIREPIVLRVAVAKTFQEALRGLSIARINVNGPFLLLEFSDSYDLVLNFMVAGKLQHQGKKESPIGYVCFSLLLDDGSSLNFADEQKMGKGYLVRYKEYDVIPQFNRQGVSIVSSEFTLELFRSLAAQNSRKQVRVFINDHSVLSSIGNAYADEILFDAKIHPKTIVSKLSPKEIDTLFASVKSVMRWGIKKVEEAHQPIHVKVRDHMKVRGRQGEKCSRCGTIIRREGVLGYDVFFCPGCQPVARKAFLDWNKK